MKGNERHCGLGCVILTERGLVPVSDPEPKAGLVTTITGREGSNQSLSLSETKPEIHKTRDQYGR